MKKNSFLSFLAMTFLCLATTAFSQIPRTFSYQGKIVDQSSIPVNGTRSLTVSLYSSATGGIAFYSQTSDVLITEGVFSVLLGSVTPIPSSVSFDKPYFLGLKIDDGDELTPRMTLASSPYSLNALNAANAVHATTASTAEVANSLSANASGLVHSVNEQSGSVIIKGTGAASVTTSNNSVIINVPTAQWTINQIVNNDSTILVTGQSGPLTRISVAKRSITGAQLATNTISTIHLSDHSVTAPKISSGIATSNYVLTADGSGNAIWASQGLLLPFAGILNSFNTLLTIINNSNGGDAIRGVGGNSSGVTVFNTAIWGDGGTNYNGVFGTSNGGAATFAGVVGQGINSATGVFANSADGDGLLATSTNGRAAILMLANNTSTSNAVDATTTGLGNAIYAKSSNSATAGSALLAESQSTTASTIKASYIGAGVGTALELNNGALKVTGTNKAAFVHTITAANRITTTSTEIDNLICNGDPNCIVMVTFLVKDYTAFTNGAYKQALGVYYDPARGKWQILSLNAQAFPIPASMNVFVIKQ